MSNNDGTISAPVSLVDDVYRVLGLSAQLGRYDIAYACGNSHGRINMWSRMKPVRHARLFNPNDAMMRDANYGLTAPLEYSTTTPNKESWRNAVYSYAPPRGNASEPYRIEDFNGYNHNAKPPVDGEGDITLTPWHTSEAFWFNRKQVSTTDDFSLGEFPYTKSLYPCVVLYFTVKGQSSYAYKTAEQTFEEGGRRIDITYDEISSLWSNITYKMCGFSTKKTSLSAANLAGTFCVLPSDEPLEGSLKTSSASGVTFTATGCLSYLPSAGKAPLFLDIDLFKAMNMDDSKNNYLAVGSSSGSVSLKFTVKNNSGGTITIRRNQMSCRVSGNLVGANNALIYPSDVFEVQSDNLVKADSLELKAEVQKEVVLNFRGVAYTTASGATSQPTFDKAFMTITIGYIFGDSSVHDVTFMGAANLGVSKESGISPIT